jgi:hypothetical protein
MEVSGMVQDPALLQLPGLYEKIPFSDAEEIIFLGDPVVRR